jgi:DNA primase
MSQYDLSRPVVERVRDAADLVTVVGDVVTLRKSGRNWMGLCPFHGEKTASFSVSREKGTYYCFGCKRGGDVIDFVMETERLSFAEAVERLAERFGVELPLASPGARRRREEADVLADALEAAQACFMRRITGDRPRAFLERRGVTLEKAAAFGLGYAPAEWRALFDELHRTLPERVLLAAGLVAQGEGGRCYDRFRDRITIPIHSSRGKLIAFGARTVGEESPKYLNSPETALFSKSRVLFALDRAAKVFGETERAIVVEGYFDCIALHLAGFGETIATLGTSLSEHHVKELARKVPRVVVCFDGDSAGRTAAVGAVRALLAADLGISVLLLPEGQDPDDIVRSQGRSGFVSLLESALDVDDFLVTLLGSARTERRANLLHTLELAEACPNPVRRFALRERLARAAEVPLAELGSWAPPTVLASPSDDDEFSSAPGEWALVRALLFDLPVQQRLDLIELLPADTLEHPLAASLFTAAAVLLKRTGDIDAAELVNQLDEPDMRRVLAAMEFRVPQTDARRLAENLRVTWERAWKRRRADLGAELEAAQAAGDSDRVAALLEENKTLIQQRKGRERLLGELEQLLARGRPGGAVP